VSEDVNAEHLLDVFTSADTDSDNIWDVCAYFMDHLYWHKPRLVVLGPKFEGLPDNHPSKPQCLFMLSLLISPVGNQLESKRLLGHALKLCREQGDDIWVAQALTLLSDANRQLAFYEEGISQAKEALDIYERLCDTSGQVHSLRSLARSLHGSNQLDTAQEAASRALDRSSAEGDQFQVSHCHRLLGDIFQSKGESEAAVDHFEMALGIASRLNLRNLQFWTHYSLAWLFFDQGKFGDACTHIEHSKSHAVNYAYNLGCAMDLHATTLFGQGRFEEAKSEVLCAAETFEKLGAAGDLERCRELLLHRRENKHSGCHPRTGQCW